MQYENGIHEISNNEYHASEGISRSMLMDFKRSPHHYWYKHISGKYIKEDSTPAMNLGSAVHTLVLEVMKFDQEFFVTEQETMPRKGTPALQKVLDEANGRIVLPNSLYIQALELTKAVKSNEDCLLLLEDCHVEQSIYFTHKQTGLQIKVRPDAWLGSMIIDLKTAADASHKAFQREAVNRGYFTQAAMMSYALESIDQELESFIDIVVEKSEPYPIAIYQLSDNAIEAAKKQFDDLMLGLKYCMDNNSWPSYGIRTLEIPKWAEELEILE